MIYFIIWILFPVITASAAGAKGRSPTQWFWYGLLCGPIALIHVLVVAANTRQLDADAVASGAMRKCPFCAEIVKSEALVCRFCQRELPAVVRAPIPARPITIIAEDAANRRVGMLLLLGLVFLLLVGSFVAGPARARAPTAGEEAMDKYAECVERGMRYFESISAIPKLSDGRDARSVALEHCGRSTIAF